MCLLREKDHNAMDFALDSREKWPLFLRDPVILYLISFWSFFLGLLTEVI